MFTVETAPNGAARIAWLGQSELNASQILQAPVDEEEKSALSEVKEFLRNELQDGPMAARQVKKNAHDADVSERTLKRAEQAMWIKSEKDSDGSWTWSLPAQAAKVGQPLAVGPLGPLTGARDAESSYLSEEGQGGQGGQGFETGDAWSPWQDENPEHRGNCLCDECLPV